jgi:hypothetical protein
MPLLPSDKSLGYCQTTLRVEELAIFSAHELLIAGNDKANGPEMCDSSPHCHEL